MSDIFINYASEDRERARALAQALEGHGWSVWWDREIPLGCTFDEVIEQAIAGAGCMLVLWSAASTASEWVRSEATEGKRRGILVPVFLEEVEAPQAFRLLNGTRLDDWDLASPHTELDRLIERVAEVLAQGGQPASVQPNPPRAARQAPAAHFCLVFVPCAISPEQTMRNEGIHQPGSSEHSFGRQMYWKRWDMHIDRTRAARRPGPLRRVAAP